MTGFYYPFGAPMKERKYLSNEYRYGFQGQEMDDEIKGAGNLVNYKYRMHDTRLGRFFAVDSLFRSFPWNSTYAFSENGVTNSIELEGLEAHDLGGDQTVYGPYRDNESAQSAALEGDATVHLEEVEIQDDFSSASLMKENHGFPIWAEGNETYKGNLIDEPMDGAPYTPGGGTSRSSDVLMQTLEDISKLFELFSTGLEDPLDEVTVPVQGPPEPHNDGLSQLSKSLNMRRKHKKNTLYSLNG